ncbi:MAG: SAM-dependent methyltransferase [Cytophagales bacterium]|nr:SAM-dependent methyltransferase [Cytophagales bacterium]
MKGKLYLIPTLLAENTHEQALTPFLKQTVGSLDRFLCENVRTARRFVAGLRVHASVEPLQFDLLDKDTAAEEITRLLEPLQQGHNVGLLSESGCPGVADPGALAADLAHRLGIKVVPLVGPSSLVLALMASGLDGQRFTFHGYLPIGQHEASAAIRAHERESVEKMQTQIYIETPFRNNQVLSHFLRALREDTRLCIALNLTGPDERISTRDVGAWKKETPVLEKTPATFLFLAAGKDAVNS